MNGLESIYNGARWGYAFLKTDARLSEEDRNGILRHAIIAYLDGEDQRDIEGEGFEGRLYNSKRHCTLGAFTGCKFTAELDIDSHGKSDISFLVTEYINPALN